MGQLAHPLFPHALRVPLFSTLFPHVPPKHRETGFLGCFLVRTDPYSLFFSCLPGNWGNMGEQGEQIEFSRHEQIYRSDWG